MTTVASQVAPPSPPDNPPTTFADPPPEGRREKIIANLLEVIANYRVIAEGPRPGLAVYATKRIPVLEEALARHRAS